MGVACNTILMFVEILKYTSCHPMVISEYIAVKGVPCIQLRKASQVFSCRRHPEYITGKRPMLASRTDVRALAAPKSSTKKAKELWGAFRASSYLLALTLFIGLSHSAFLIMDHDFSPQGCFPRKPCIKYWL